MRFPIIDVLGTFLDVAEAGSFTHASKQAKQSEGNGEGNYITIRKIH